VRYGDANPALQTRLTCDPHLPHGAIVTKVEFTLYDNDNSSQFGTLYCHLARNGTGTTTFTSDAQELAAVVTSGSPGVTRLSDDTIPTDYATVNAMTKAYWLYCDFFYGSGKPATALGVFGADVYFKITPAKG
jgi:hypothetical protein